MRGEYRKGICAWCVYWHVDAPKDWKPPGYNPDASPTLSDWMESSRKEYGHDAIVNWPVLTGKCGVDPQRIETTGAHDCARFVDWFLEDPKDLANDYCNRGWKDDRLRNLQRRNERLKRQVAHHKKLAESRLERLNATSVSAPIEPPLSEAPENG